MTLSARAPHDAGSRQDATVAAIRSHHGRIGRTVADHALTVQNAIDRLSSPAERRDQLLDYCVTEVLPHAEAEEAVLYKAAGQHDHLRLLVKAMCDEHVLLRGLVDRLAAARTPAEVGGAAAALDALLRSHLDKENDVLLPALVDAGTDLAALLEGMHEILGPDAEEAEGGCACGGCGCGAAEAYPADGADGTGGADELDVRVLPHAQRHERIFATFAALAVGTSFVLVNDHDPRPLYNQFAARFPGEFSWEYLETGPREWRVRVGRL
ncbi:DUF2249 domain-containing protein [Nocardiopsis algeriensis]|uniref:Uncharacterized protein (DUF2249 family) n=1 Tax=Nocardiopsis algeriensis TaxID=1478215 RepID=A0A841ISJ0_9ACTN|nr:DUF2249 domain-containing protein [Nocardiopsis algeriensis]MBB6121643.1 uncharacterized protein (DUF2249 family) [Nocardiopsis algeriensis]